MAIRQPSDDGLRAAADHHPLGRSDAGASFHLDDATCLRVARACETAVGGFPRLEMTTARSAA